MKIAILGAGGVGGYFGGMLARAGEDVVMLARGDHLAAIRGRGIEVGSPDGSFTTPVRATDDPGEIGAVDYVIVAVKSYSLDAIAPAAAACARLGATVVPLLNGVEAVDQLVASGIPAGSILGGMCIINAVRSAPGVVERRSGLQTVIVGEVAGGASDRADRLAGAISASGAIGQASADILVDQWRKFAFIASVAAACGLARSPIEPIRSSPLGRLLIERAVAEAVAVGRARGVALPGDAEAKVMANVDSAIPAMKPSFLLDLESGGPTEWDNLFGAIARFGRELGVPTPVHDTAAGALGIDRAA